MAALDWITITLFHSGLRKRIRPHVVTAYWTSRDGTFGEINGNPIQVVETEAELAHLLGDDILAKAGR